ncbi:MAG TPA: deoxyguanosinetriphosphate triphosphohydrolase [Flavobacteriaceae bacterium]|nr:deoxyguanosinetriphosphate triphosphohydrolase [Flavobacteriaceae bacterium]
MHWESLLSLKRHRDNHKRLRKEQDETRLNFEVDYDRIVFSEAFRSLQDKTQVIPLSKTAFVHTRLTHSMEVSVVGRSLGRMVGKKILEKYPQLEHTHSHNFNDFGAIVATAALAHDIGNPPFGHSGEKAIGDYFKSGKGQRFQKLLSEKEYQDLTHFEGNANGFKLLTETKDGVIDGLRLSYAVLGAFVKYPKESLPHKPSADVADKKYGFFQSQKEVFHQVATDLGLVKKENGRFSRHPLAFLVEAADDICYTIIDFEDGINLGLIQEEFALEYLINLVRDKIKNEKYSKLTTTKARLGYLRSLAIQSLISDAARVFLENEEAILKGTFSVSLLEKSKYSAQINDILKISKEKVYQSKEVLEKEIAGYKIISTLLDTFTRAVENNLAGKASSYDKLVLKGMLPNFPADDFQIYSLLLETCCHIASLTDGNAVGTYQKLQGVTSLS